MTNTERNGHVEAWKRSAKSMAAYCREEGLGYQAFRTWTRRFGPQPETAVESEESPLVKLEIPASSARAGVSSEPAVEITAGPFRVMLPAYLADGDIERILSALAKVVAK